MRDNKKIARAISVIGGTLAALLIGNIISIALEVSDMSLMLLLVSMMAASIAVSLDSWLNEFFGSRKKEAN